MSQTHLSPPCEPGSPAVTLGHAAEHAGRANEAAWAIVGVTSDVAKRELRAYLGVTDAYVKPIDPGYIQANIEIKNTGSTPAHDVSEAIIGDMRDSENPRSFVMPPRQSGKRTIVPGGHWIFRFDLLPTDADMDELHKSTEESEREMFVWGKAAYRDTFGDPQTLEFRYRTHAKRYEVQEFGSKGKFRFIVGWDLHPEEDSNDST